MAKKNNPGKSKKEVKLLLLPSVGYASILTSFLKKLKNKKVCYVTLNTNYDALVKHFNSKKVDLKNYLFIDGVTRTITNPQKVECCIFLESPKALTQLSVILTKIIGRGFEVIVLDSLSTLLVYHDQNTLTKFVHDLVHKVKKSGEISLVLTLFEKDENTSLFKNVSMVSDKVSKS